MLYNPSIILGYDGSRNCKEIPVYQIPRLINIILHLPPQARLPRVRANPRPRLMISRELVQETAVINDLAFYVGLGIGEDRVRV